LESPLRSAPKVSGTALGGVDGGWTEHAMATRRAAVGQRADVEAGASLDDDDDKYDIRAKPHDATAASSFDGVATWIFLGIGLFTRFCAVF
jgi:hypothetical protein